MSTEPQRAARETDATVRRGTFRALRFMVRFPYVIVSGAVRAAVYSAWYLAFYILCMFRPLTGFMMLTAIVMVPMSIAVYAHPDAANGIPFWVFGLMAIGLTAFAIGYTIFLDWFTPPGAEDPFTYYRRSDRQETFAGAALAAHHGIALTKRLAFAAPFMSFRRK